MARLVKCYGYCNEKHLKTEMIKFKGANHCPPCYERKVKDTEDRERLYNMLKETFNLSFPTGLMLRQIKQFREERDYSYKNIAFTVDYMTRHKKIKLQMQYGIALVPHYYDEMIAYYKDLKRRRDNMVIEKQSIKRIRIKPEPLVNEYREKKFINMNSLIGGNENGDLEDDKEA